MADKNIKKEKKKPKKGSEKTLNTTVYSAQPELVKKAKKS